MGCLKKILIGIGVLVVLAVIIVIATGQGTTTQSVDIPLSEISFTEIDEIYKLGSTYTDLQKEETWKKYDGKKVQWSGTISEISETIGTLHLQVKMKEETFTSDLIIALKDDQKDKALKLSVGETVTFIGVLDSWGTLVPISLKDGEIVAS